MRILRRADYRRMPWKNGGGLTEEIAVHPPGADMDGFDWRLSIAHVDTDGPFSRFPGIDRSIAVLSGGGMGLSVEGGDEVALLEAAAPFAFDGGSAVVSRLFAGPTVDLNIMTRRGRLTHWMQRIVLPVDSEIAGAEAGTLLVATAPFGVMVGGETTAVTAFDTVQVDAGERLGVVSEAAVIRIDLAPVR
ncbi:HutD family protein [Rhizobium sp. SG2393]|uniref:HutD/Ves family protein n=1 Tax=Rhizobium sp. SG2393 TaxID=3276279 RepID=UPI003672A92B